MLNRIIIMLALLVAFAVPARAQVYFPWVGPHGALPTGAQCAQSVPKAGTETRPENTTANNTIPTAASLVNFYASPLNFTGGPPNSDFRTVDGNYKGTTDEIFRWAACKWGIDEDTFRAESYEQGRMTSYATGDTRTSIADCEAGDWDGWITPPGYCFQSYGIMQLKARSFNVMPMAWNATAFNVDVRGAYWRACINGDIAYLDGPAQTPGYPSYPNGTAVQMQIGCGGAAESGKWYDSVAIQEIGALESHVAAKPWLVNVPNPKLSIILPLQNSTVSGNVTITVTPPSSGNPNYCYACLSIDGYSQENCGPGPFTWDTMATREYGQVTGYPIGDGHHVIQLDAYTCSGNGPLYHAAIDVTVNN